MIPLQNQMLNVLLYENQEKLLKRFNNRYIPEPNSGCWLWTNALDFWGYGRIKYKKDKYIYAHRFSYEIFNGVILPGLLVCHRCDISSCVNPEHLWLGSNYDNMQDMIKKGRDKKAYGKNHWTKKSSKLNQNSAEKIRTLYKEKHITQEELSVLFNVNRSNISHILRNKIWK